MLAISGKELRQFAAQKLGFADSFVALVSQSVWHKPLAGPDEPVEPSEVLALVAAKLLMGQLHGNRDAVILALGTIRTQLQDALSVPALQCYLADGRFFSATHNDRFYDLLAFEFIEQLPAPPLTAFSFDLARLARRHGLVSEDDSAHAESHDPEAACGLV